MAEVRYVRYRCTAEGALQFSAAAPDFHTVRCGEDAFGPVFAVARDLMGREEPVGKLLRESRFRAAAQHVARFALLAKSGVHVVPVNTDGEFPYEYPEVQFSTELLRSVWRLSATQRLDLLEEPARISTVIPGAQYAHFNLLDSGDLLGTSDALHIDKYRQPGELWSTYLPTMGELPDSSQHFSGILVSGGMYSAYDRELQWLAPLEEYLRRQCAASSPTKVLGVCLGCQLLAQALGGRVTTNPSATYHLFPERITTRGFFEQWLPDGALITESHGDCVAALPPQAQSLGTSLSTEVELWGVPGKVLCVQGHPEFSKEFVTEFWIPWEEAGGTQKPEFWSEAMRKFRENPPGAEFLAAVNGWLRS